LYIVFLPKKSRYLFQARTDSALLKNGELITLLYSFTFPLCLLPPRKGEYHYTLYSRTGKEKQENFNHESAEGGYSV